MSHLGSIGLLASLTTLRLQNISLNEYQLRGLGNIKINIETIELIECSIDDSSVGEFFASCPKLKSLRIGHINFKSSEVMASLFQRIYPMLEYFHCHSNKSGEINQLIPFLERNQSINCLRIEAPDFLKLPLTSTTIQLDYLNIDLWNTKDTNNELPNRLKMLNVNGFFSKLRLSVDDQNHYFNYERFFGEMISLSALEVLKSRYFYMHSMRHLTQLKELNLHCVNVHFDWKASAMSLINLERLRVSGSIIQLLPFLRHSKNLRYVIFGKLVRIIEGLNLCDLNNERKLSEVKRKILLGLHEDQYLNIKWNENDGNYDLIEITRAEMIRKHFYDT